MFDRAARATWRVGATPYVDIAVLTALATLLPPLYAVNALRNGVGVFEVARNMGTSVQIIQEYYGRQATPTVFATRLGD
jgi:hypothetical protein